MWRPANAGSFSETRKLSGRLVLALESHVSPFTFRQAGGPGDIRMKWLMSGVGTNRTNGAGLLMSVVRGRPAVTGRATTRLNQSRHWDAGTGPIMGPFLARHPATKC